MFGSFRYSIEGDTLVFYEFEGELMDTFAHLALASDGNSDRFLFGVADHLPMTAFLRTYALDNIFVL
jgi:hypothetical protein